MKNIMKWTGIVLGGLIGLALLAGVALYPIGMKKLTRTYPNLPVEAVNIPTGSEAVARGRHIAIVWKCTECHGESLSGTLLTNDPFLGTIPASNLTSGKGGIAKSYTDADWIRAIRHGVMPNSRVEAFIYDYSTMSDRDLGALIAYLKQIPPVDADYPAAFWTTSSHCPCGWAVYASGRTDRSRRTASSGPSAGRHNRIRQISLCALHRVPRQESRQQTGEMDTGRLYPCCQDWCFTEWETDQPGDVLENLRRDE